MTWQSISLVFLLSPTLVSISILANSSWGGSLDKKDATRYNKGPTFAPIKDDNIVSFDTFIAKNESFISSTENLFVLLHIQKTGGTTFERHLVEDLGPKLTCGCMPKRRRCKCLRKRGAGRPRSVADITWLMSRFSTGWVCGLHPDYTQLSRCLSQEKNLLFLTFLRHPLHRFISEFRHVQRGATWKISKMHCRKHDTQLCFGNKSDWSEVNLDEFIDCNNNMAHNRQTRMLANFENKLMCNSSPTTDALMLSSAMNNLEKLAYFGLCEHQRTSQALFEKTFKLKFSRDFSQSEDNRTQVFINDLSPVTQERIIKANDLDMRLYNFSIELFARRCERLAIEPEGLQGRTMNLWRNESKNNQ